MKELVSRRNFLKQNTLAGVGIGLIPQFINHPVYGENDRFTDHGTASPRSQHRGIVATVDGNGRDVVLTWLFDHRGGYGLLMIDAQTGKCEQFDMPFSPGDAPYASILSTGNKFYTLFKGHFVEFDPVQRRFTASHPTHGAAMSMTEDDRGIIWSASYPNCGLTAFDPASRQFTDYGFINKENWLQYPRSIASDDKGWIYVGLGYTQCQILAFHPGTREVRTVLSPEERVQGIAHVYRNLDGKVYGNAVPSNENGWISCYSGETTKIGTHTQNPKPYIADSQALFYKKFKSGREIVDLDLNEFRLITTEPGYARKTEVEIEYTSDGAIVMGVCRGPDNTICGGTAFPMRQFIYHPEKNEWKNYAAYGQFNTVESDDKHLYVGGYPGGFLLRWDPGKSFQPTRIGAKESNPQYLGAAKPHVYRPFRLYIHPDQDTIICTGSPDYGRTGGGMLIWKKNSGQMTVLKDEQLIPHQSTMSLAALGEKYLIGGTSTQPGTGGEKKAKEAVMYIMEDHKIIWQSPVIPGAQQYTDFLLLPNGKLAGFADQRHFFVFDPVTRALDHQVDLVRELKLGPTVLEQGPRVFVTGPEKQIYVILRKGIAALNPNTYEISLIAEAPKPIRAGGAYLNGAIWFVCDSHLWSYRL